MFSCKFYISVVVGLIMCSFSLSAQTYTTGRETIKADVNFTELSNYYKAHPASVKPRLPFEEDEREETIPRHKPGPASEVHLYTRSTPPAGSNHPTSGAMLPLSPTPDDTFKSSVSPGSYIPPDTHGAVDSQYCVTATNACILIQNRTGTHNYLYTSLDGFWSSILPAGTGSFDPRVHYDPFYKRWILVTDAVAGAAMDHSTIMVAVSATNDPTGIWHMYAIAVDPTGAAWLDYPNVGFNKKWITVTGNMFPNATGGASGGVVYVFDYVSIMAGTGAPFTKISKSSSFSICPVVTYDINESSQFCVETWNAGSGQLRLWKITGPTGTPTMTSVGYPTNPQHWHSNDGASGDFGPQVGTTNKIDLGDHRIFSAMFRNGKVWCTHNAFLPSPGTANRCSIMWWQVDTNANPLQVGLIDNPVTGGNFYAYPSISVNKYDDALIGMGVFSTSLHPSAAYAWRLHTDPIDSMRPVKIYRHGQSTYYTTFGGGRNRWGDYSGTCIDPRNDEDFWTIQETSHAASASANWETWWANVQICPKPQAPVLDSTSPIPCPGGTMYYSINPIAGATSYVWLVSGAGWTGSSTSTSITLTAGTGVDTVTVLAYNACGEGEALTMNVSPVALPTVASINIDTGACTGRITASVYATSVGATSYYWQAVGTGWSGTGYPSSTFAPTIGTGVGTIICVASNTCGSAQPDTLLMTPGTPTANFTLSTHNTVVGANVTVTYAGTAAAGAVYGWNFGGGIATPGIGVGPHTVNWSSKGLKTITLNINYNNCFSTYQDTVRVRSNVGVNLLNAPSVSIDIVPNPNEGSFDVVFIRSVNKAISIKMTDMEGRVVYSNEFTGTVNNRVPVTTSNLPAGIYAISISVDGDVITKKLSINR